MKNIVFKSVCISFFIIFCGYSSLANLPNAIIVSGWGNHAAESWNGIYLLNSYIDGNTGQLRHQYKKIITTYLLSIEDNSPWSGEWFATAPYGGGYYRQELPLADPTANSRWEANYQEWYPAPKVFTMDSPDKKNPNPTKDNLSKDPINTISGAMLLDEQDLGVSSPGISLGFTRNYNSCAATNPSSIIGYGWTHNYDWTISTTTKLYSVSGITLTNSALIVDSGDGRSYEFIRYGLDLTWKGYKSTDWTIYASSNSGYRLVIPPASQLEFDSNGVFNSISDLSGNYLSLIYTNSFPSNRLIHISHSNGEYLNFAYSAERLAQISTSATNLYVVFSYNQFGDLTNSTVHTSIKDHSTSYTYNTNHTLSSRIDANNDYYAYSYETNDLGQMTTKCIGMILNNSYYKHNVDYHSTNSYSQITYFRGETQQVFQNYYDTNSLCIVKVVGPENTNLVKTLTYEPTYQDVTEELIEDGTIIPKEYLRIARSYDSNHKILTESSSYCSNITNTWSNTWHQSYQLPTMMADPEGHKIEIDYTNALATAIRVRESSNVAYQTTYAYTSNGLLNAVTNANGHWSRYLYDGYGNMTSSIPQVGPVGMFGWTVLGILNKITLPGENGSRSTLFDSDEMGLVSRIEYPDQTYESFLYDNMRQITNHVDIAGRTTRFTYAPAGRLSSVTRYLTNGETNQAVTTSIQYDNQFNSLSIKDTLDRVVEAYVLDLQDRPTSITNLEGQTMTVNYGLGSFVKSITRFDGTMVSNKYDGVGRLVEVRYPGSTNNFNYLKNDLLVRAANEQGYVTNTYNGANRLISSRSVSPSGSVSYAYFPAGQVSTVSSVAGSVSYANDGAERVEKIDSQAGAFTFGYNSYNGLLSGINYTNSGLSVAYEYDSMDRVKSIVWKNASNQVLRSFNYGFNSVGLIDSISREDGSHTEYSLDSLDRLTGETQLDSNETAVLEENISYDLAGNRVAKTRDGLNVSYSLGSGNQLSNWNVTNTNLTLKCDVMGTASETIGNGDPYGHLWISNVVAVIPTTAETNFSALDFPVGLGTQKIVTAICDVAGNTTYATSTVFKTVVTNTQYTQNNAGCVTSIVYRGVQYSQRVDLSWDGQYQVSEIKTNGATAERYGYDALGRRAWTWDGVTTNWYVYDGMQVVADVDYTGRLVRSYVWGSGIDNVMAMTIHTGSAAVTYYAIKDHLGTVHAWVNGSGTVIESYRFDAWGRVLGIYDGTGAKLTSIRSPLGNRYLWQGREYSWKTGLYFFRARWYDPIIGRWLSNDPIGISGGLNQYVFCGNDPVNNRDPYGLVQWRAAGGATLGVLGNSFGLALGFGLALVPEPTMATKVAAVVVVVKSSYGLGANVNNLVAAVRDQTPASNGALANDIAELVAPGNANAQRVATVTDLTTDLAVGRIAGRATQNALGRLYPYDMKRMYYTNPDDLGPLATRLQVYDLLRVNYDAYSDICRGAK